MELAKKAAGDHPNVMVAAGMSQSKALKAENPSKKEYQEKFEKQVRVYIESGVDILICEVRVP